MRKIILTYLVLLPLFATLCNAQQNSESCLLLHKKHRYYGYNLNGPVKSVRGFYTDIKESLSNKEKQRVKLKNDVRPRFYTEFNDFGLITKMIMRSKDYRDMPIDSGKVELYEYDEKDFREKLKCRQKYTQSPSVYNQSHLLLVNNIVVSELYGVTYRDIYLYEYDDEGKVIKETDVNLSSLLVNDSILRSDKPEIKDKDVFFTKLFFYDDTGKLVKIKIEKGEASKYINYNDFGTEASWCKDLQINYKYDSKNRIIQIVFFSCNKVVFQEDYTYHPKKGYVTVADSQYNTIYSSFLTPRVITHFNENGDITERNFIKPPIPGVPNEEPELMLYGTVPANHYYDYDYDSHGNWIRCRSYLEGKKEGEPSTVSERVIEYYK